MNNPTAESSTIKNKNLLARLFRSIGRTGAGTTIDLGDINEFEHDHTPVNEEAIMELYSVLHPTDQYKPDAGITTQIRIIADRDLELLRRITSSARNSAIEREYWRDKLQLSKSFTYDKEPAELEQELSACWTALTVTSTLREIVQACNVARWDTMLPYAFNETVARILKNSRLTDPTEDLIKAVSLLTYMKGLEEYPRFYEATADHSTVHAAIESDAAYIAEHVEQVLQLIPELIARKAYDRVVIERLLNNYSQSLREGEL